MPTVAKTNIGSLESLLQIQRDGEHLIDEVRYNGLPGFLKATKSASLDDFIDMVCKLVTKSMKKLQVEFVPDEGARLELEPESSLDHPYILFDVISRTPLTELKPRAREDVIEQTCGDDKNARQGMVWGQRQKVIVQFHVLASDYRQANQVMNSLEELIFKYTAYLKRNGVAEILFLQQGTDRNMDYYRQSASVRTLQYRVDVEKLFVQFETDLEDAIILGH